MKTIHVKGLESASKVISPSWKNYHGGGKPHYKYVNGDAALIFKSDRLRPCRECGENIVDRFINLVYCAQCYASLEGPLKRQKRAHARVRKAIFDDDLPRLDGSIPCTDCGGEATCYDHRDYSKPLDVQPVCYQCNKIRGRALNHE